jgi:hypothetical protein
MSDFRLFNVLKPSMQDNIFLDKFGCGWFVNHDGNLLKYNEQNDMCYVIFDVDIQKSDGLGEIKQKHNNILQAEKLLRENGYEVKKIK